MQLADGSQHDVIYLADMANQIWAFDAATGHAAVDAHPGDARHRGAAIDSYQINDHWGC